MLDIKTLLPVLKKLVTDLSEDLLARSTAKNYPYSAKVDAGLREAYTQIEKGGRTADAFEVWREDYLDQVAVAWVLGCVFVRFMEDNHLIDECWLAGDGEALSQVAVITNLHLTGTYWNTCKRTQNSDSCKLRRATFINYNWMGQIV